MTSKPKVKNVAGVPKNGLIGFLSQFPTDDACRTYLEARRWPNGATCPRKNCAHNKPCYTIQGKSARAGLYKCGACRRQFTVTIGTIFEDSKVGLQKWFLVIYLMGSSKKGMSAHQIHRSLGVSYETAWFMCHRVREAMRNRAFRRALSGTVEADETYIGQRVRGGKRGRGAPGKTIVFGMVERGGNVHAQVVPDVTGDTLKTIIRGKVKKGARLLTDEFRSYNGLRREYRRGVVRHLREYVRGKDIHVNTQESFWALLKRGITGTFHHVSGDKLNWYCGEFGFRFNNRHITDAERFVEAVTHCDGRLPWYLKGAVV